MLDYRGLPLELSQQQKDQMQRLSVYATRNYGGDETEIIAWIAAATAATAPRTISNGSRLTDQPIPSFALS